MIIENKILLFLYDFIKTGEFVKINHLFADNGLSNIQIRDTILKLRDMTMIEVNDEYRLLGKVGHGDPYTLADISILARLTAKGEMYAETVLGSYLKSRSK